MDPCSVCSGVFVEMVPFVLVAVLVSVFQF